MTALERSANSSAGCRLRWKDDAEPHVDSSCDAHFFLTFSGPFVIPWAFAASRGSWWVPRQRRLARETPDHLGTWRPDRTVRRTSTPIRVRRWITPDRSGRAQSVVWCETRSPRGHSFFSARRIVGPVFRKIHSAIKQDLKTWRRIAEMHTDNAVIHLPAIPIPLTTDTDGLFPALGNARFVHASDRVRMSVIFGHNLLAAVSKFLFVPLDRFKKSLQCPRSCLKSQGDCFSRFALQA